MAKTPSKPMRTDFTLRHPDKGQHPQLRLIIARPLQISLDHLLRRSLISRNKGKVAGTLLQIGGTKLLSPVNRHRLRNAIHRDHPRLRSAWFIQQKLNHLGQRQPPRHRAVQGLNTPFLWSAMWSATLSPGLGTNESQTKTSRRPSPQQRRERDPEKDRKAK